MSTTGTIGSADLVVLGSLGADVYVKVDTLPGPDGFAVVTGRDLLPGGSACNVAAQAARLGARCAFIGQVGRDELGTSIVDSLQAEGIDTAAMPRQDGGTSLSTTVVVDAHGSKFILLDLGDAFGALAPEQVDLDLVRGARVLYTDLLPGAAGRAALLAAHGAGIPVVLGLQVDLATMAALGTSREQLLELLPLVDHLLPSGDAWRELTGTDDLAEALRVLRTMTPATIVVTRGELGARALLPDGAVVDSPAVRIEPVDTTGAGDSFAGTYVVEHVLNGLAIDEALARCNAAAAITCAAMGARSGPDRQGLESSLA